MNTDRSLANAAVRRAVLAGSIPPARSLTCGCGRKALGYHHTNGYAEADRLVIEAVCSSCHKQRPHPKFGVRYHKDGPVEPYEVEHAELSSVRLSPRDDAAIRRIIQKGFAQTSSGAIRVALQRFAEWVEAA